MQKVKTRKKQTTPATATHWVGIGASAGGLEALRGFVNNLPENLSATFIVAQHMAPHHKSMLSDIIGRETSFSVLDVTDNLLPKPSTIYITPPNSNIVVKRNRLRLIEPSSAVAAPKPSIDVFFESLAKAKGKSAIGIIFSGTGSDGAKGIAEISKQGGIAIAQDELSAKYTSMPAAAIESGQVDLIMAPEDLATRFAKIIERPKNLEQLKSSPTNHGAIAELVQLLMTHTNVNFAHYKTPTFQRRVERRMAAIRADNLDDYLEEAKESPEEVKRLFQDLLISVTSFFRDPAEFETLETYIDHIVQDKDGEPIRVWVPGVATGEEAYSIAILFFEAARKRDVSLDGKIQIFATDLDKKAIEMARRGYYPESGLAEISADILSRYFDPGPKGHVVKKFVREHIVFSIHNVAQDPPFLKVDMISCRNLMIYFQASLQAEVFSRFHYSLIPNGLLFVGKSEAISASDALFRPAGKEKHIFFQRPTREKRPPRDMLYERPASRMRTTSLDDTPCHKLVENANTRFDSLVRAIGPNGLLINNDLQIIRSFGDVSKYVSINAGTVSTTAASLLKSPYRQDVQFTVPSVIRQLEPFKGIVRVSPDDPTQKERVSIYPLENGLDEEVMALVVFNEWKDERTTASGQETSGESQEHIAELNNELSVVRIALQQTVEELETSNEELKALNEELQSSNEELQSTNEELETSNEELQSTNEELSTVNEELQVNSQQLNIVNHNLSSVLLSISLPLIVVDRSLTITHVSRVAEEFFGITSDLALPHISRCQVPDGFPDLTKELNCAIEDRKPFKQEISTQDRTVILSIVPHYSNREEPLGAIIVVTDNSEMLEKAKTELQIILDNVPSAVMVRDASGNIIRANKNAHAILEKYATDVSSNNFYDRLSDRDAKAFAEIDANVLNTGKPLLNLECEVEYAGGTEIYARVSRIPGKLPGSSEPVIYAVTDNITEQREAAIRLENSERRLAQALNSGSLGVWERDFVSGEVYWSKGIREFVGITDPTTKLTVEDITSRVHPDDLEMFVEQRIAHFERNEPYKFEYRIRREDGEYIYVEANAQAERNEKGEVIRFTGTLEDMTEKRANYLELKARQIQMNMAADLSGIGYWEINFTIDQTYWSEQVFKIFGIPINTPPPDFEAGLELIHPDDRQRVQTTIAEAVEERTSFEFETRILRSDCEIRTVQMLGAPNLNDQKIPIGIFGVLEDITDEKSRVLELQSTLEELSRSNEELNRFSYICSHDMKEPVRMIEAMASLLVDPSFKPDEEKQLELLQRISKNTTRLRSIIESLLAYSRIDAKVETSNVDLNSVLSDIHESLSLAIEEQGAELQIDELPTVFGAKVHFTQLFQNLIGNALKFSDKEKPEIRISASERNDGWMFSVDDNGPGIPAESRDNVFELFGRLQRQDDVEGSGLGLSIAEKIVHQYDGTITCSDSPMGGARFEIFLKGKG